MAISNMNQILYLSETLLHIEVTSTLFKLSAGPQVVLLVASLHKQSVGGGKYSKETPLSTPLMEIDQGHLLARLL